MSNIYHQTVEDILRAASPEQKILWNWIFLTFGERIAISQVCFNGVIAGSEFATYQANKYYVAYQLKYEGNASTIAAAPNLALFDRLNVQYSTGLSCTAVWDATAAAMRYMSNANHLPNIHFSRVAGNSGIGTISIIGYRLGI